MQGQEVKHFGSFSGYQVPFRPVEPITEQEALAREAYYVGTFEGGQMIRFEKILHGEREFLDEYIYWPSGKHLQHRRLTKHDGSVTEQDFDQRGKLIR